MTTKKKLIPRLRDEHRATKARLKHLEQIIPGEKARELTRSRTLTEIGRNESKIQSFASGLVTSHIRAKNIDITRLTDGEADRIIESAFAMSARFHADCNRRWKKLP